MPETDKILADLHASIAGVADADGRVANAIGHANEVQARMAVTGFAGIAAGLHEVTNALGQIRSRLHGLAEDLRGTAGTVQGITADTSPEQAATRLSTATERLTAASSSITAIAAALGETGQRVTAVLHGGQPGPLIALIDAGKDTLTQAGQPLQAARTHADEVLREARTAGK